MDAAAMLLELHEGGVHAVQTGGRGGGLSGIVS